MFEYIVYVLLGFVVGSMVGVSGLGGGALMTPALILIGIEPIIAVGTDLVFNTLTKVFASIVYKAKSNIDIKKGLKLFVGSIPAIILGFFVLKNIDKEIINDYLSLALGIILILISIISIYRSFARLKGEHRVKEYFVKTPHALTALLVALGAFIALLVQFTSVGAGILVTLALLNLTDLKPRTVVGTSLFYGLLLGIISALSHIGLGTVNYGLAVCLMIGGVPGILGGFSVNQKVPQHWLRRFINIFILVLGLLTLTMAILNFN